jgi:hypothetical protein
MEEQHVVVYNVPPFILLGRSWKNYENLPSAQFVSKLSKELLKDVHKMKHLIMILSPQFLKR